MAAKGVNNGNSKLTEELVRRVRQMYYVDLLTQHQIAKAMKLSQSAVSKIINWKVWENVPLY
jgi:DNA-binding transcriptional regulator LsrR (DeoR family)